MKEYEENEVKNERDESIDKENEVEESHKNEESYYDTRETEGKEAQHISQENDLKDEQNPVKRDEKLSDKYEGLEGAAQQKVKQN